MAMLVYRRVVEHNPFFKIFMLDLKIATFSTKKNGGFSVRANVEAREAKLGKRREGLGVVISIGDFIGLQRASHDMPIECLGILPGVQGKKNNPKVIRTVHKSNIDMNIHESLHTDSWESTFTAQENSS